MPRSLSGVKTGEFDTLEVSDKMTANDLETQGVFTHTGSTPAEFDRMTVGTAPANEGLLTVNGNIACSAISTSGLEAPLTFTLSDGSTTVYNGGTARSVTIPATQPTFRTLTLKHGLTTIGTFDPVGSSSPSLVVPPLAHGDPDKRHHPDHERQRHTRPAAFRVRFEPGDAGEQHEGQGGRADVRQQPHQQHGGVLCGADHQQDQRGIGIRAHVREEAQSRRPEDRAVVGDADAVGDRQYRGRGGHKG